MIIEKNDKTYRVIEYPYYWKLQLVCNVKVSLDYTVTKKDCPNFEKLKKFVLSEEVF